MIHGQYEQPSTNVVGLVITIGIFLQEGAYVNRYELFWQGKDGSCHEDKYVHATNSENGGRN